MKQFIAMIPIYPAMRAACAAVCKSLEYLQTEPIAPLGFTRGVSNDETGRETRDSLAWGEETQTA